jgi:hypothetical protein
VSRTCDPSCPVPNRPCLRVLDDYHLEVARARARDETRPMRPCRTCGERNIVALGGKTHCYSCRVRPIEKDHVRGSGSGPAVIRGNANLNRISEEGERVLRELELGEVCTPCRDGYALRVGIFVASRVVDV